MTPQRKQAMLAALGNRLRKRRRELDLTLLDLSRKSRLSKAFLCGLEHGKQEPGLLTIDRLSRVLGLSLNFLIRGKRD